MDQSSYVAGFFGVLIGITLTELIKGVAETLKNAKRSKYYVPHGILVFTLFILIVQSFFDFQWLSRDVGHWTPLLIIRFTIPWIILCLCSYLVFPSFEGQDIVHFKYHFDKFLARTFKFAIFLIPLIVMANVVSLGKGIFHFENLLMMIFLILVVLAMVYKRDWLTVVILCSGTCYLVFQMFNYP